MSNTDIFLEQAKEQLKNLAPILDLTSFVKAIHSQNIEYRTEGKPECIGYPLFNDGKVAIQLIFMEEGAIFPRHQHIRAKEWLLVYSGRLQFFNGYYQGKVIKIGESMIIEKGTSHRVKALEDCWMVAITIPAATGYPK